MDINLLAKLIKTVRSRFSANDVSNKNSNKKKKLYCSFSFLLRHNAVAAENGDS